LAGYFIPGQIICPPSRFRRKRLRTQRGVTQYPGRIFGPEISFRAGYFGWPDNPAKLWPDNPPLRVSNGYILGGAINTPPLLPPQATRPAQEDHLILEPQKSQEVSLAQLAMGVDVQPRHPGSNPHRCEFGFLLFI
jgi:hypothetical protein